MLLQVAGTWTPSITHGLPKQQQQQQQGDRPADRPTGDRAHQPHPAVQCPPHVQQRHPADPHRPADKVLFQISHTRLSQLTSKYIFLVQSN